MLFPMEQLFESFVAHWIKRNVREVGEYEVKCQEKSSKYLMTESRDLEQSGGLFALNPDMIMRGKGEKKSEILILDTKWKIPDSKGDEKKHGIAQADLYQMWAYASKYALESKRRESSRGNSKETESKVSVWLIYPLCERTKALAQEWQDSKKHWHFKASIDTHNPISLSLAFFPLLSP